MKYLLIFLPILIASAACDKLEFKDSQNPDSKETAKPKIETVGEEIKDFALLESKDKPNSYYVVVNLPENFGGEIKKKELSTGNIKTLLFDQSKILEDHYVTPGKSYEYIAGVEEGNIFKTLKSIKVDIPQDLDVDSPEVLIENIDDEGIINFEKLFFTSDSVYVENKLIKITAKEIHFNDVTIMSFNSDMSADTNAEGLGGGELIIEAKKVFGTVHFNLNGQIGGAGLNAPDKTDVARASLECIVKRGNSYIPMYNGEPGTKGSTGKNSGQNTSLSLSAEEIENFDFTIVNNSIPGGKGGQGGLGSLGDFEGINQSEFERRGYTQNNLCRGQRGIDLHQSYNNHPRVHTQELLRGPRGPVGDSGNPSSAGYVCISAGGTSYGCN